MVYRQEALDRSFSALSHPARRRLVEVLSSGPASVGTASRGLGLSKAAVTKHVRVLEDAGLVRRAVEGRTHQLRLVQPRLADPADWLGLQRRLWASKLDTIEAMLSEERRG
ncbi:MAG TPA: metalloregulator ArsR/SmtB family transcription factor [Solirubrobacteraceae bacterium]